MLLIKDLTLDAWGRRFLEDASAAIPTGAKVGLVGRNGVGKSTLFKLIVGGLAAQEGDNAVARYREVMGATNPANAAEGTIRKLYAESVGENSVHGSDSPENAAIEIAQFFTEADIVG